MDKVRSLLFVALMLLVPVARGQEVEFLQKSGMYADTFHLELSAPAGYTIRYTLDGCRPTSESAAYIEPLSLSADCYSPVQVFRRQNCPDTNWLERDEVEHIIVVRAALFDGEGRCSSEVGTQAYVVNSLLGRTIHLPVVSLCVDTADLFDYDSGIFVMGANYTPSIVFGSGNYFMRGREWEKKAHFAFMTPDGETYSHDCGIRIHGGRSRAYMQKGFTLYARKEYGDKKFRHRFFDDRDQDRYKRLVLRPWTASWSGAGVEDWLCQLVAKPLSVDALATRPVALFLNGEYWGIYFLQEKSDEHYVEEHYGYDDETVDVLADWGFEVENGSNSAWMSLLWWIINTDLTDDENYRYLSSHVDIEALIDYMLLEVFTSNVDWPSHNVRQWSVQGSKWRWFFFDGDACFADWRENSVVLEQLTCNDSTQEYPSSPIATVLFRRLLERPEIRAQSTDRFGKLIYSHFNHSCTQPLLDSIVAMVADEVPHQVDRFGTPVSASEWSLLVRSMGNYLASRPATMFCDYAAHIGADISDARAAVFPNPSTDAARVGYDTGQDGVTRVTVHDLHGRQVASFTFEAQVGHNEVALPQLPAGGYLVSVGSVRSALVWIVAR